MYKDNEVEKGNDPIVKWQKKENKAQKETININKEIPEMKLLDLFENPEKPPAYFR